MKYEIKNFFGKKIRVQKGMGSPYRPDNFFPLLFNMFMGRDYIVSKEVIK